MYDGPNTIENYFSLIKSEMVAPDECVILLQVVKQGPRLFVWCVLLFSTHVSQGYHAHWLEAAEGESTEDLTREVFVDWAKSSTQLLKFQWLKLSHMTLQTTSETAKYSLGGSHRFW